MTMNEELSSRLHQALSNVEGEYVKDSRQVLETLAIISSTCPDLTKKYGYDLSDIRVAYMILVEPGEVETRKLSRNISFLNQLADNEDFGPKREEKIKSSLVDTTVNSVLPHQTPSH